MEPRTFGRSGQLTKPNSDVLQGQCRVTNAGQGEVLRTVQDDNAAGGRLTDIRRDALPPIGYRLWQVIG